MASQAAPMPTLLAPAQHGRPTDPPEHRHARHHAALPLAVAGAAAAAGASLRIAGPGGSGALTPCPIRALTGLWCPGCGLTRATHRLLHGDVVEALSFNALTPVVLAALGVLWFTWWRVATGRGVPERIRRIRPSTYVLAATVMVAFAAVRNLPGAAALRGG